jgi:putative hydrolase
MINLKILADTHTHTISSGHAYSTVMDNAKVAAAKGLEMIAITDHGPTMEGAPTYLHFGNLKILPSKIEGVRILKGVESNIMDYDGRIDLKDKILERLDFVLAAFHDICIEPMNVEINTNALIGALKRPHVDAIAHPGNPMFPVDIERVVLVAKDLGKFIEINNYSFTGRKGSESNCREFALMCIKHGVKIVCGSDAHYCENVGNFQEVIKLLEEVNMPEELIMSMSSAKFEEYIVARRARMIQTF